MWRLSTSTCSILWIVGLFTAVAADWKGFPNHPCDRDCSSSSPMTCHYELELETYTSMSKACYLCPFIPSDCDRKHCVPADGFARLIYTVNRQLPSPQIRVCEGDSLDVSVKNHMNNGEGTSIHWHGLHQVNRVDMDGVSMLTQCPILPLTDLTYRFEASPHGTHWYHAHVGMQRGEGLAGALIIGQKIDPHRSLYDFDLPEHTLMLQDWFRNLAGGKGMLHLHARDTNRPDNLMINGRSPEKVSWPAWHSQKLSNETMMPYSRFNVTQGQRYRFRLISNVVMNCPIEVYIEGHNLTVIASDGASIEPVQTDVLVIAGGERWDFILDASSAVDNYWMYVRGLTDCSQRKSQTLAVLHYSGASDSSPQTQANSYDQRPSNVKTLNPFSLGMVNASPDDDHIILTELKSEEATPSWLFQKVDKQIYLHLGLHKIDSPFGVSSLYGWNESIAFGAGGTVMAQINRVHGKLPSWPYLTQYDDIPEEDFCDLASAKVDLDKCAKEFCSCVHRVQVELGDVVELIMLDRGKHWNISNHPMHIHGHYLYVLAINQNETMITSTELIRALDKEGKIHRNFKNPIKKDTIMIPDGGFVVTRFKADNPGPWFLHCHNELHVEQGMAIVIQSGQPDQWPQSKLKQHKCGAYRDRVNDASSNAGPGQGIYLIFCLTFLGIAFYL